MKKRILSAILTLCMALTMLPTTVFAAEIDYISSTEALKQSTEKGSTLTINADEDWFDLGDEHDKLGYSRLILNNANGALDFNRFEAMFGYFYHVEEVWFAPDYNNISDYLDAIDEKGMHGYFDTAGWMNRGDCYVVFSENTPSSVYEGSWPHFGIRTYSGDLSAAVSKGISATKNPCTNHDYTMRAETADRVAEYQTCTTPTTMYYSCANCGQCEYNKNHTFVDTIGLNETTAFHDMGAHLMTADAYIGVNTQGQRIYWESCYDCKKSEAQILLANGDYDQADIDAREARALAGGNTAQMFVVDGTAVTAKHGSWAQNEVNWAKQNGLVDEALLGGDYTRAMTRLEFCSVAVKMAERMSQTTITPAPTSTFTDTTNEYVLKAYAAGITSGIGDGTFSPDATLNRQQMATFIHRALQYVAVNSTVRYTDYTSKLGDYTDSGSIASWAKEPLAFMNALGLIKGTSDTMISPNGTCTIEQALIVANRSLDADKIGWYLVRTDVGLSNTWGRGYVAFESPQGVTPYTYVPGETYWVTGGRWHEHKPMIEITEPYTGATLIGHAENFVAIRD